MKGIQLFFRGEPGSLIGKNSKLEKRTANWDFVMPKSAEEADVLNWMFLEETKDSNVEVPCVIATLLPDGRRKWLPYLFKWPDCRPCGVGTEQVPRCFEILIETASDVYNALLATGGRAVECYLQFENETSGFEPSGFDRPAFEIAARWVTWERNDLSWQERAEDLFAAGVWFNKDDGVKNARALESKCRRLNLQKATI